MASSQFICGSNSCKKFLENPVTLPVHCGLTICQEHIKYSDHTENVQIKCDLCSEEHEIPAKFLVVNKVLSTILKNENHLSDKQKELKAKLVQLETILLDHEKSKVARPEEYIYDYFADIRNQIDLHREESILEIQNKCDALLKELKDLEDKCKANQSVLKPICFDGFKNKEIFEFKDSLRKPDISEKEIDQLLAKMKSSINDMQDKIDAYKRSLTLNKEIVFFKKQSTAIFGELKIINTLKEFKEVTNEKGDKYVGEMLNGVKHGHGTYNLKDGYTYIGYWDKGVLTGEGVLTLPAGDRYEGEFKDYLRDGFGTYYFADGNKYVGQWSKGNQTKGVFFFNSHDESKKGDRYEGEFVDSKFHGQGTYYYANGESFTGQWTHGRKVRTRFF
jgi:hypothetical protein